MDGQDGLQRAWWKQRSASDTEVLSAVKRMHCSITTAHLCPLLLSALFCFCVFVVNRPPKRALRGKGRGGEWALWFSAHSLLLLLWWPCCRDGADVEIVGLCKSVVSWLARLHSQGHYPFAGVTNKDGCVALLQLLLNYYFFLFVFSLQPVLLWFFFCLLKPTPLVTANPFAPSPPPPLSYLISSCWKFSAWAHTIAANFERHFWIPLEGDAATDFAVDPQLIHRRGIYKVHAIGHGTCVCVWCVVWCVVCVRVRVHVLVCFLHMHVCVFVQAQPLFSFHDHDHPHPFNKDVYGSTHAYSDYQLRPNVAIAMTVAPGV